MSFSSWSPRMRDTASRERERESRGDLFQSGNKTRETNWRKYFFGRRGNRYSAEFASVPVTMQWSEKGRIVWQFVKWLSIKRFRVFLFFFFLQYFPDRSKDVIFREEIHEKYENVARDRILNVRPEPHNWMENGGFDQKEKKKSGKDGDCSKRNEAILVPPHKKQDLPSSWRSLSRIKGIN